TQPPVRGVVRGARRLPAPPSQLVPLRRPRRAGRRQGARRHRGRVRGGGASRPLRPARWRAAAVDGRTQATAMYERFVGLGEAPFGLTPAPRYLSRSRKHADALAHLRLGLSESSGFVCITGDVGTGKTPVLRHFLGELAPAASVAYVINPTLSPLELLQT